LKFARGDGRVKRLGLRVHQFVSGAGAKGMMEMDLWVLAAVAAVSVTFSASGACFPSLSGVNEGCCEL
jgi:hypothetical protein